ncbi:hypothetical protein [Acetobacter orleanensis]|uniref:Uncharacterized protein n=1 Tax=Acetobacter orleanensis TaxID=104099 RepID=A0A4Y3TMM4_9PROT|nr:hypothetical protein [Acetobacter orleanensis]KXV65209.1 hypothetical protein AD949_04905 [Acetobacter orleanensis]PCD79647.1 hypothetical protein CO710_05405 [Acetobacter orleanensis]GAN68749.1 hypothetical protein Abol_021_104 [Acetobacter orleanensis JCM 7639]GBR28023.1 hypothetical protein AA0473_1613 [Acetobacter orleanensis NRIC 0473]GEB82277.1 hypothetical protein AOR01nite_07540 [Acetobacter orleanensis]
MTEYDYFYTALQTCGVFLLSLSQAGMRWAGGFLLPASLCLDVISTENTAFAIVFWVCALAFAVITTALVHTARRWLR